MSPDGMRERTYSQQMETAKRRIIKAALKRHAGNLTHAAWSLRIDRGYIRILVKKYGL